MAAQNLPSGDIFVATCPKGSIPQVEPNTYIPEGMTEFWVLAVRDNTVELAPLKLGSWNFEIPCSPTGTASVNFSLVSSEEAKSIQPDGPLGLLKASYHWTFWFAFLLIFSFAALGLWKIYSKFLKPKLDKKKAQNGFAPKEPSGLEIFSSALREFEQFVRSDSLDTALTAKTFKNIQNGLRRGLEERFSFSAPWATTPEFLGTLKLSLWEFTGKDEFLRICERSLYTQDRIRFSGEIPKKAEREALLKDLENVYTKLKVLGS